MKKPKKKKTAQAIRPTATKYGQMGFILTLLLLTFAIYAPSIQYDFVNWDDFQNVKENMDVRDLSWEGAKDIFSSTVMANYNPLPIFTFAVEYHFFGMNPTVFHLNNILLHLVSVIIVFFICLRLGFSQPVSLFTAGLFALHPMRVESVVWITERKDVLYAAFFFGSILSYLKYKKNTSGKWPFYALSLLLFVIALFAKIQAVSLPLALLALDYLEKRSWSWSDLLEKVPYFLGSLVFGLLGIYFLSEGESLDSGQTFSFLERLFIGGFSYLVYLYKAVIPYPMSPLYPYPATLSWTLYAGALVSLGLVLLLFLNRNKKEWHVLVSGFLFFTVNVVFVLQIVGAGQGFLADRFTYVPYFGLFLAAAHYLYNWLKPKTSSVFRFYAVGGIILFVYALWNFSHHRIWKDGEIMWTHVLEHYPNSATAWSNRGQWRRDHEKYEPALQDYSRALQLEAEQGNIYNGRGKLYFDMGETEKALKDFNRGIQLVQDNAELWVNRGVAHASRGQFNLALKDLNRGLQENPDLPNGYLNRSLVHFKTGNYENAIADYDKYLGYEPGNAEIWYEKGLAYRAMEEEAEAVTCFDRALELGTNPLFYLERSKAHRALGNISKANLDMKRFNELQN
ncbi:MAG TPA: tetratricopeptide repeat protein [Saprospiraceae bacterium]|nr:tetratricopeptide repeat protein [Saprospiraceae bacterium]